MGIFPLLSLKKHVEILIFPHFGPQINLLTTISTHTKVTMGRFKNMENMAKTAKFTNISTFIDHEERCNRELGVLFSAWSGPVTWEGERF